MYSMSTQGKHTLLEACEGWIIEARRRSVCGAEEKCTHARKIHSYFKNSSNTCCVWEGIQVITNYRTTSPTCDTDILLPYEPNDFDTWFEVLPTTRCSSFPLLACGKLYAALTHGSLVDQTTFWQTAQGMCSTASGCLDWHLQHLPEHRCCSYVL